MDTFQPKRGSREFDIDFVCSPRTERKGIKKGEVVELAAQC